MVIPFFGRKPAGTDKSDDPPTRTGKREKDTTSLMDFTHVGDMGRALAAAAGKIRVSEAAHEEHPAVEEAAVLYANANDGGARAVLEAAIDEANGKVSQNLWNMLFDLYRLTGDKAGFDTRAVAYAEQFEISPPIWDDSTPETVAPKRDAAPAVNLSGQLSGNARTQFEQLARIGAKAGKLRIDLSRLRGIDDAGCELLVGTLDTLKRSKVQVAILGAEHAASLVVPKLKVGEKEGQPYWLLGLSLIQQTGDQDRFDEVALNYAITFEESPPSWEPPPVLTATDAGTAAKAEDAPPPEDEFMLEGEVTGGQPEVFRHLVVFASPRNAVNVNASKLKRLEFVSAGVLFNQLAQLQGQGKLTIIRHPNALVAALLQVMGVDQVAQIELKRR